MKEDQEIMLPIYREHSTTLKNKKEKNYQIAEEK